MATASRNKASVFEQDFIEGLGIQEVNTFREQHESPNSQGTGYSTRSHNLAPPHESPQKQEPPAPFIFGLNTYLLVDAITYSHHPRVRASVWMNDLYPGFITLFTAIVSPPKSWGGNDIVFIISF